MRKKSLNKVLLFLKMFSITFSLPFIFAIIINLVVNKLFYKSNLRYGIPFSSIISLTLSYSITWSLFNIKNYTEYSMKIIYGEEVNIYLIAEIQKIMKKMHWALLSDDNDRIIFKASLLRTIWPEYIVVIKNKEYLELTGSKIFVEKLMKKLY